MQNTNKLISSSVIAFVGTFVGSVFSYLFNMLMGRMLGPTQYGEMTALLSLLLVASVGGGAFLTVTMKYSSEIYHLGNFTALRKLFYRFSFYFLIIGVITFIIGLFFIQLIANFFAIGSKLPIIITLFSFIFGYLIVVSRGILQGTQQFTLLSFITSFELLLKLIFGLALVKLGFALSGALAAMVLATICAYFILFFPIRKLINQKSKNEETEYAFDRKDILNYTWPTLLTTLFLAVALNLDVILIKHYFSPESAGLYSAVSTVAKIIIFITSPITLVMFPMVSEQKTKGNKHYRIFHFSLLMTLLGGMVVLGIYMTIPGTVLKLLYGPQYTQLFYILPQVGTAFLFYSLVNLLVNYFLVVKDFFFLYFLGFVLILETAGIVLYHPTIDAVVRVLISSFGLLFFLLMLYYLFTKREQLLNYFKGAYEDEFPQTVDNNSGL